MKRASICFQNHYPFMSNVLPSEKRSPTWIIYDMPVNVDENGVMDVGLTWCDDCSYMQERDEDISESFIDFASIIKIESHEIQVFKLDFMRCIHFKSVLSPFLQALCRNGFY